VCFSLQLVEKPTLYCISFSARLSTVEFGKNKDDLAFFHFLRLIPRSSIFPLPRAAHALFSGEKGKEGAGRFFLILLPGGFALSAHAVHLSIQHTQKNGKYTKKQKNVQKSAKK